MDNEFNRKYNDDDIVMLTSIRSLSLAQEIERILNDEGIECFLRNFYSSAIMGGIDVGGVRIDVRYKDVEKALSALKREEIELPDENDSIVGEMSSFADKLPFLKNMSFEKRLWIVIIAIFIMFGILILVYTFFQPNCLCNENIIKAIK